jgi:hypothetical protein
MNKAIRVAALASLLAMFAVPALTIQASAVCNPFVPPCDGGGNHAGAPGPLLGAGLPFLGLVGGVYWIARRFRRKGD